MSNSIIPTNGLNGQTSLKARQFALAFLAPNKQLNTNIARLWLAQLIEAKSALNSLQFALDNWIENGEIPLDQFSEEFENLSQAGLEDWADSLLAVQLCVVHGQENGGQR